MAEKKGTRSVLANLPPPPKPPAKELAAIRARAVAAGFRPTDAAVLATYNRNQARTATKPQGRSAGGTFSTVNRKAPTRMPTRSVSKITPREGLTRPADWARSWDRAAGAIVGGEMVDAHVEIGQRAADVLRYVQPGSERQFIDALGRAFAGAIPGRVSAPRGDTWEALHDQQTFRRKGMRGRPPPRLTRPR